MNPGSRTLGLTIISGGQTGVDRGALDAALELGVTCGGWCPEGRRAEDGLIPSRYPLRTIPGGGYSDRTRRNVQDSDATLIIHSGPLSGGTRLTLDACRDLGKPVHLVDAASVSPAAGVAQAMAFIAEHRVGRLNVAGPRQSQWQGAHTFAHALVYVLLSSFHQRIDTPSHRC